MENYSHVFQETLNRFASLYVPGDQGDAGKGQVTALAGYTINQQHNANVGYIGKSGGQTQYHGISVDALKDKSDGTWADYLTDELQPDGRRLIKLLYSPNQTPGPTTDWVQPTEAQTQLGGPLVLKSDAPAPEPTPPSDQTARFDAIDAALVTLSEQQSSDTAALSSQQAADTATVLAAIQHFEDRFNQIVEDVEESLQALVPWLIILWRREDATGRKGKDAAGDADDAAAALHAWVEARRVAKG